LAHGSALDQHYGGADTACASAAFFAALDVRCYQWVARGDICAWDDVCAFDGESGVGKDEGLRMRKGKRGDALPMWVT